MKLSEKIDSIRFVSSQLLKHTPVPTTLEQKELISRTLDILAIDIQAVLDSKISLHHIAPRFLLRRWGLASFRMAMKRIEQAKFSIMVNDQCFVHQSYFAGLWAYQACDLFYLTDFLKKVVHNLENYTLYTPHLEKGDVIVSYKTDVYLKDSLLSKIIAFATNTHITHSFIVAGNEKPHHLVSARPECHGIGESSISPKKGEMFVVLRYRSHINDIPKEKILESLDTWWPRKNSHQLRDSSFAELRSWVACIIGFVYLISISVFGRAICFPNPVKKNEGVFCSEFVDEVYKQAGVYLSPRSENSSVVGPIEFFYSPYLEFKGIIFHAKDEQQLLSEIKKSTTLSFTI